MANASFVNIDLDESQLKEVEEEAEDKNKDQEEEGDKNDESSKKQETSSKNRTTTVDPAKLAVKSAQLDRLGKQLVEDYSKYYRLNSGSQIDELNECIDNLLTHMEEFYGLVEMIRAEGGACIDQLTSEEGNFLESNRAQLQGLFRMIDKLERIVGHVGLHLSLMEREVARAEKAMGKRNAVVSRLFSLISSSQSSSSSTSSGGGRGSSYVPPDIFKVEDLMQL